MSYIDFDDAGIVEVRCMNCGTPVIQRSYIEVPDKNSVKGMVKVAIAKRLSNYTQVEMDVDSGSRKLYMEPIVCKGCANKDLDGDKLLQAITEGWLKESRHGNVSNKKIEKLEKMIPGLKFVGKVRRRAA